MEREMQPLRELLPESLWKSMIGKLGREEALRRFWPAVVGQRLAAQSRMRRILGNTLVIAVPDEQWSRALKPLEKMMLEAVNKLPGSWQAASIEFVAEPWGNAPGAAASPTALRIPPANVGAHDTGGASLQEVFSRSEKKYFARQQELRK